MYFVATARGFLGERKPTRNVRFARPFESFEEADGFAKFIGLVCYAVLRSV